MAVPSKVPAEDKAAVAEARELVADLCRHFYTLGWVSGTGTVATEPRSNKTPATRRQLLPHRTGVALLCTLIACKSVTLTCAALDVSSCGVVQAAASASK